jgi:hypothetical protein
MPLFLGNGADASTGPSRVYVVVSDASGEIVARRYLNDDDVAALLGSKASTASVRCDVFSDAPVCGGTPLTSFVACGRSWRESGPRGGEEARDLARRITSTEP